MNWNLGWIFIRGLINKNYHDTVSSIIYTVLELVYKIYTVIAVLSSFDALKYVPTSIDRNGDWRSAKVHTSSVKVLYL